MLVIRIVLPAEPQGALPYCRAADPGFRLWIEQLRYAGMARIHRDDDDGMCFDLYPPARYTNSREQERQWADSNSARMQSFGINAVTAPEMPPDDDDDKYACVECGSDDTAMIDFNRGADQAYKYECNDCGEKFVVIVTGGE